MPVERCRECCRGLAGYLDSEKELSDLTAEEVASEIQKYEAKERRIRGRLEYLKINGPQEYSDGASCPACGNGWREFQEHRKDLEQLSLFEARSALAANTRYLDALLRKRATP